MDCVPCCYVMTPLKEEWCISLKEAGLMAFGSYFEIWGEEHWKHVCPGKANYVGWDEWVNRTVKMVDIFGRGHVTAGFVPGVECMPEPYGFGDDIDAAVNSTLEGYKFLYEHGVIPVGTNLIIEPGSLIYKWGFKRPPLEFYAKFELGRWKLAQQYNLSAKQMCYKQQPYGVHSDWQRLL